MFARAWEDGIITYDEHQLITEVVEFLGMHPDRIKRLSEEAREINRDITTRGHIPRDVVSGTCR